MKFVLSVAVGFFFKGIFKKNKNKAYLFVKNVPPEALQ